MTQSLWFFGNRFNIIADHTTTGGQYDLLEGEFTVWAGQDKVVLNAGENFLISLGTPHTI
jgi:quercetin dioxygenase-like cupin family protein